MNTTYVLAAAFGYLAVLIAVGWLASRRSGEGSESYFLADRGLKRIVLFAAVFGTNISAFVMLGLAGLTYRTGVSSWAILIGPVLLLIPLNLYLGHRCWLVARRRGYVTPVEFYRERFDSEALGILMFIGFVAWTIPYILTGIVGAGTAFATFTGGTIPYWAGALLVTVVVGLYTLSGGMLGTAWTNTVQVAFFLLFLLIAVIAVPASAGGVGEITTRLVSERPELLSRSFDGPFGWGPQVSNVLLFSGLIFAFPFVWMRMVAARASSDLRFTAIVYPVAVVVTWGAAVLLGLWGAVLIPGLEGPVSDTVIFALTGQFLPAWMTAFGLVALLAMVMSSMDAQALTVSNMLSSDIIKRYASHSVTARSVLLTRLFVFGLLGVMYGLSFLDLPGIFDIATFAFTGFAAFYPVLVGGIFWRRATKQGAVASLLLAQALAVAGFLGWLPEPAGLQPVFWVTVGGWAALVGVSLATPAQREAADRFHVIWDEARPQPASTTTGTPAVAPGA